MRKSVMELIYRWLLVLIIALVGLTTRKTWINRQTLESIQLEGGNFILGMWHNNILYFTYLLREFRLTAMISRSRDGENIARVLNAYGIKAARGSASDRGFSAFRGLVRLLRDGRNTVINPDGPRGPRYVLKKGLISLARMSGVPIVPIVFSGRKMIEFRSWDRMKIPYPFSRVIIYVGNPIWIDRKTGDDEEVRLRVEKALREAVIYADNFAGGSLVEREPLLAELLAELSDQPQYGSLNSDPQ